VGDSGAGDPPKLGPANVEAVSDGRCIAHLRLPKFDVKNIT
jgi:hypothetical protein